MPDVEPLIPQTAGERDQAIGGFNQRFGVQYLRTDMAAHAFERKMFQRASAFVDGFHLGDIDAELVFAQSGGDIRVRRSVNVRIGAQRHAGGHSATLGQRVDQHQLRLGFAVETVNTRFECVLDLIRCLAYAGKHHARRIAAGLQHTE